MNKLLVSLLLCSLILTLLSPLTTAAIRRGRPRGNSISTFRRKSQLKSSFPRALAKLRSRSRSRKPSAKLAAARRIQKKVLSDAKARQKFQAKQKSKKDRFRKVNVISRKTKNNVNQLRKKCRNKLKVVTKEKDTLRLCDIRSLSLKVGLNKKLIR